MSTLRVDTITDEVGTGPVSFPNGVTGVEPFKYNAVSGATQALDVGSYNFFDAGTLTADTTVSFSNVPTEARWTYTADVGATEGYSLDGASLTGKSFSFSAQDSFPAGLFFKPDGTKMYMSGQGADDVFQYTLSTPWDIATASYDSVALDMSSIDTNVRGLFFKPDGTKLFISGASTDRVYEYLLSTAWDISTASYDSFFSVSAQDSSPADIFFKPDGTKFYLVGSAGQDINQYSLGTAWDISTASFDSKTYSLSSVDPNNYSVCLTPDGTKLFTFGDEIHQHTLSTAWDISTASYDDLMLDGVGSQGRSLRFKDGNILFSLSDSDNTVKEIYTSTATSITLPSSVQKPPEELLFVGKRAAYTFFTADGGTNVYLINEEVL